MADKEEELNNPEQNLYKNDPKKFIPKLYNFKVSKCNAFNETVLASSPPFWVLVDHLVGVVWKLYSKEKDGRKLGIMQLQWALEFIKMIKDDRGNLTKTLEAVKNTIEDSLILKYACLPTGDKRKKCEEPEDDGKQRPTVKSFEGLPQTSQSASLTLRDVMSRLPKTETLRLQVKKAASSTKRDGMKKVTSVLAPVFDLNSKKDEDGEEDIKDMFGNYGDDLDWNFSGEEYDPLWPNDYEKVVKDLRELREKEKEREDEERQKKREERRVRESRFEPLVDSVAIPPPNASTPPLADEENDDKPVAARGGAAIAPPPSLMEQVIPKAYGASVAAKIMAKYGFKEGQGLGKKEQGISMALQVEKTSKRGGRIVHEKDIMPPPPPAMPPPVVTAVPPPVPSVASLSPPRPSSPKQQQQQQASITEIMKAPSKVVLLKNMVGPGEVDEDLEPEVKDECNTKYGEVVQVIIFEIPDKEPEEAVRIFVEFKRIESAIKAVVDLNGRFFGGRQVKAGFYPAEKIETLDLLD
ncbi:hypothetical protein O3M35_012688 [Rhynocoris fuscipes]|uniref:Splicing factor 45 n=1 Tax=Rhynocoris fuscipes TaxID=488301 RepID=A0AAW1CZP4_9HEMI